VVVVVGKPDSACPPSEELDWKIGCTTIVGIARPARRWCFLAHLEANWILSAMK
jgi:hypothetical protein